MPRFLISNPNLGIDASFSPFKPSCVHRFLNSGPDLRIDASFSPIPPSCVHRFLNSGPDLGIDAKKPSRTAQRLHRFLISSPDLRITARFFPETHSSVQRFRISWGQFGNRCKESLRIASCCSSIPRPTLTFVAAQKNSPSAAQSWGAGGTGWHEGGIILSKKPPEWRLSPPQQQSASDSNLRRSKEEKPPEWRLLAGMSR